MEKFVLLFIGGIVPDELVETNNVEWGDWLEMLSKKGHLIDTGAPLDSEGKVITDVYKVRNFDWATDSGVNGYTVIKAASLDDAVEIALTSPHLPEKYGSGTIEVRQLSEM
jgi:uncharacterized protein YciI